MTYISLSVRAPPSVLLWCDTFVVLSEAVAPQQEDAVGRRYIQVDVLEVEQDGEQHCPL